MSIPKTLFALLTIALMLGVAACGDDDEGSASGDVEAPSDLSGSISLGYCSVMRWPSAAVSGESSVSIHSIGLSDLLT